MGGPGAGEPGPQEGSLWGAVVLARTVQGRPSADPELCPVQHCAASPPRLPGTPVSEDAQPPSAPPCWAPAHFLPGASACAPDTWG